MLSQRANGYFVWRVVGWAVTEKARKARRIRAEIRNPKSEIRKELE
jgi:hypothetical protein